jgi:hypothetical protein
MAAKRILSSWSCKRQKGFTVLCLHLATDGNPVSRLARLRLISIAGDYGSALLSPDLLHEIIPLLEDPSCKVVGHDMLFIMGVIRATIDRRLNLSNCWDTMIAWQLINNGSQIEERPCRKRQQPFLNSISMILLNPICKKTNNLQER